MTFGTLPGWPELLVLDSTDPAQVRAAEARVDLGRTLFVVSSKSGTTLEPNIFKQYFFERARQAVGADKAGDRFIAITDPGSKLEQVARADGFRHVLFGVPSIGGRYSALSDFGMVPAALMGLDVERLLDARPGDGARLRRPRPRRGKPRSRAGHHPRRARGAGARQGHAGRLAGDPRPRRLAGAASGRVDGQGGAGPDPGRPGAARGRPTPMGGTGSSSTCGSSRRRMPPTTGRWRSSSARGSRSSGSRCADPYHIGAEFFRWEFATAVAGAVLGIHPFDQPDVEASKVATRRLTDAFERAGRLPAETPIAEAEGIRLFADPRNARDLAEGERTLSRSSARPPRADPARRLRRARSPTSR